MSYEKSKLHEDWVLHSVVKNINDFSLKLLMKTDRCISLAHLHLLSTKSDSLLNFYLPVWKLHLCFVGLDWLTILFVFLFFWSQAQLSKNSFLFLSTRPVGKNYPSFASPLEKSPLMWPRACADLYRTLHFISPPSTGLLQCAVFLPYDFNFMGHWNWIIILT